eukprot:GHVT01078895.1.p2 GENE.GHVT01078895.1~~GHVT01078895.1.p2  ORF type:complete len:117 (-),score=11.11 GHVT01078895.1:107-457(-)
MKHRAHSSPYANCYSYGCYYSCSYSSYSSYSYSSSCSYSSFSLFIAILPDAPTLLLLFLANLPDAPIFLLLAIVVIVSGFFVVSQLHINLTSPLLRPRCFPSTNECSLCCYHVAKL